MPILSFSLNPESLGRLHDALVCLGKFSESVSIEATHDKLILYTLNSSKSAPQGRPKEKFNCKIYNKALLSVFKGRSFDPEKETAVERCDVVVEDGEGKTKSRFIIKIICRHGVLKTYRLTFESIPAMHAVFSKESANNKWSTSSKTLREFIEYFGPGTEQLDIYAEGGRVSFTSYTEKVMSGNEILKQPLHTTIAIDIQEFADFSAEEKLHLVISVKDFKSIITHAGLTNTMVKAMYSRPSNPLQLSYGDEGLLSEFILMTIGDARGSSAPKAGRASSKIASKQPLEARSSSKRTASVAEMGPPSAVAPNLSRKVSKPSPPPPQPSIQSNALFFPEADDDRRWDPVDHEDEDDGEMLLWDAGANHASSGQRLQRLESQSQSVNSNSGMNVQAARSNEYEEVPTQRLEPIKQVAPTQRLSEIHGIFDD
ncbi:hypothetical protein BP5796_08654 [Coleophoma crateriformis]|uniref:DNA repair protein rad9 n=1 Tax=Coleophoma crateriformis TaxID=565419 RepID=A0A3D8R881_9HELO|nr:hypothetical protein BP5796_08654 [Coleophoma crateriformis]